MIKGRLGQLLALDVSPKPVSDAPDVADQPTIPTVEERVNLFLRALHGIDDVTPERYSRTRNIILSAMASDIAGKMTADKFSESTLPDQIAASVTSSSQEVIGHATVSPSSQEPIEQQLCQRIQPVYFAEGPLRLPHSIEGSSAHIRSEPPQQLSATSPVWKVSKRRISIWAIGAGSLMVIVLLVRLLPTWLATNATLTSETHVGMGTSQIALTKGDFAGKSPQATTNEISPSKPAQREIVSAPLTAKLAEELLARDVAEHERASAGQERAVAKHKDPQEQASLINEQASAFKEVPAQAMESAKVTEGARSLPKFRWPANGRVISAYGSMSNGQQNDGINIAVAENTPVKAAEDGVVAYAGDELKGYGNLVLIRHPNGYITAYAHAKELLVKGGDQVKRGQVIARSGQSGNVNAPQLHFEIRNGATPVDPTKFLNGG